MKEKCIKNRTNRTEQKATRKGKRAMTINKLPSGSYRVEHMERGKRYRFTLDHKPTQKEAMTILSSMMQNDQPTAGHNTSFEKAFYKYIDAKSNILSPSTLKAYFSYFRNMPEYFKKRSIYDIDNLTVQKLINDYSINHSPKSTRNLNGLISTVLKASRPELTLHIQLPAKQHEKLYIPTDSDIKNILELARGSKYEIPLILATYGLRRGEICALTLDDLNGNELTINKDKIQDQNEKWIIKKTPKTESSNRTIYLDENTTKLINQNGEIYSGHPNMIGRYLEKYQDALHIPHFSLHKLRHYFASVTHEMGISDADIQSMGGWKTDHVMKTVYRQAQEKEVSKGKKLFAEKMLQLQKKE